MLFTLFILWHSILFASQTEILVTADRIKSDYDARTLKSSVVSDSKDLQTEDGIHFEKSGGYGTASFISIRGLDPKYTLVLLDGVRMNDPSNPTRSFDFSTLDESNIERIEIYKGGNALLYGADAVGGVINIISKRGKKERENEFSLGLGNNHHQKLSGRVAGSVGIISNSTSVSAQKYLGDSASSQKYNPGAEEDGFRKINFATNFLVGPILGIDQQELSFRMINSKNSIDAFGGANGDDSDRISRGQELYSLWRGRKFYHDGFFELTPEIHYSQNRRKVVDGEGRDHYFGATKRGNLLGALYWSDSNKTLLGLDVEEELDKSMASDMEKGSLITSAFFVDHHLKFLNYEFSLGGRVGYHPLYHSHENFRGKIAKNFDWLKGRIELSVADAYKAPTLFQLYSRRYGSKGLRPERSLGFDGEYLFSPVENFDFGLSYFQTKIKNKLSYDPITFISMNSGESEVVGSDIKMKTKWEKISFDISQRLLNFENATRKSHHTTRSSLNYDLFTVRYLYEGKRSDRHPLTGSQVELPHYGLFGASALFEVDSNILLSLELENIFDKYYEESYGMTGGGREILLEVKWKNVPF